MQVSARANLYDPVAAEVARSRARAHHRRLADQAERSGAISSGTMAAESRQTVNEVLGERMADPQTGPGKALSSSLAVLDITALLDAGTARVSPAPAESVGAIAAAERPRTAIDQLLGRILATSRAS